MNNAKSGALGHNIEKQVSAVSAVSAAPRRQQLPSTYVQPQYAAEALDYLRTLYDVPDEEILEFAMREGIKAWADFEMKQRGQTPPYPWGVRVRSRVVRPWVSRAERERIECAM